MRLRTRGRIIRSVVWLEKLGLVIQTAESFSICRKMTNLRHSDDIFFGCTQNFLKVSQLFIMCYASDSKSLSVSGKFRLMRELVVRYFLGDHLLWFGGSG